MAILYGFGFIVVVFLFIYTIKLLKKLTSAVNNMSNRLVSLEMANNKIISEGSNNKSLTKNEFEKRSNAKISEVVIFISMTIIPLCFADSIPNLIKNYPLEPNQESMRNGFYVYMDIIGIIITLFIMLYGFVALLKIHNLIKDKSRKTLVRVQNYICGFCIISLLFCDSFFLWEILASDIIEHFRLIEDFLSYLILSLGIIVPIILLIVISSDMKKYKY